MASKRQGTIFQIKSGRRKGKWVCRLPLPKKNGVRRRREVSGDSRAEVKRERDKLLNKGLAGRGAERVEGFFKGYLASRKRSVAFQTWQSDERKTRNWIVPEIGNLRMEDLSPLDVETVLSAMEKAGKSPRTIQMAYQIMSHAFGAAEKQRLIDENPCKHVPRPRWEPPKINPMTREQVLQLEASVHLEKCRHRDLILTALYTGCRLGELSALYWEDVEFQASTIAVVANLAPTELDGLQRKSPKTSAGKRNIHVDREAMEVLAKRRLTALAKGQYGPKRLVFQSRSSKPLIKNVIGQAFARVLRLAGLPHFRFHDLRHTHATLALQAGVHVKVLQERLGHGTSKVTLDTYGHVVPSMQADAAEKIRTFMRSG